jgi:hypothetical protein
MKPASISRTFSRRAILLSLCVMAKEASAQSVSPVAPAASEPPVGLRSETSPTDLGMRSAAPVVWGPLSLRPHGFYRWSRGDGLQFSPGQQSTTIVQTLTVGILAELGEHWTMDYSPTWTFYSSPAFHNTVGHAFSLDGVASFTDGSIQFGENYSLTNSPRIETGRQTREETNTMSVTVNYRLSQKSRLEFGVNQNLRYIQLAPNANEWGTNIMYHYQATRRIDMAAGLAAGYVKVEPGTDMDYTRPQIRVGWRPTEKLSFDGHIGAEHRRFRKAGAESLNSPNYGVGAYYQPFTYTTLSLMADRSIAVSYFADQVNENTTWSIGLNQRLLGRLNFNASAGHTQTDYLPAGSSALFVTRDDTSTFCNLRLSTSFVRRGTVGVVYQHTRNNSSVTGYSFTSNQFGVEIGYRY